jgi:hypothetical protein
MNYSFVLYYYKSLRYAQYIKKNHFGTSYIVVLYKFLMQNRDSVIWTRLKDIDSIIYCKF